MSINGEYVSAVNQTDGIISVTRTKLPTKEDNVISGSYVSAVNESLGEISVSKTELPSVSDNAINGQYVSAVNETLGEIKVQRTSLPSFSDVAIENEYVSAVNESLGQINIERKMLPDYSNTYDEKGAADNSFEKAKDYTDSSINNLTATDEAKEGYYLNAINQKNGIISISREPLPSINDAPIDNEYVSAVEESLGEIKVTRNSLPDYTNVYDPIGSSDKALTKAKEYMDSTINELDYSDIATTGEYVSAVSQSNGLITVENEKLPTVSDVAIDNQYVSAVSEDLGVIKVTRTTLPDYSNTYDEKGAADNSFEKAKSYTDSSINNLNYSNLTTEGEYVSAVSQSNGLITVEKEKMPNVFDTPVDNQYVSAVSENQGAIIVSRAELPDYSNVYDSIGSAKSALAEAKDYTEVSIENLDYLDNEITGQYVSAVNENQGIIEVTRTSLPTVSDTAVNNQYVSAVSEDQGIINVIRAPLPDYTEIYDPIGSAESALAEAKDYADHILSNTDAMVFKGTLGVNGTVTAVPTTGVVVGDTYKIITAGTWAGYECKEGDLLIAVTSGDIAATMTNWVHITSGDTEMTTLRIGTSNLTTSAQYGDLIVGEAATKNIDTSISNTSSTNVPTSAAVVNYISNNAPGTITSINTSSPLSGSGTSGSVTISHNTSGISSGTYGPTANSSPGLAGTFSVPSITIDNYGHATSAASRTITMPSIEGYQYATYTLPATAGWYRIASSVSGIQNNVGIFTIRGQVSGRHTSFTMEAGISYNTAASATCNILNVHSYGSNYLVSKVRIVYHSTYSGNYAYLEMYQNAYAGVYKIFAMNTTGWTLNSTVTEGEIPDGYSSKEFELTQGSLTANTIIADSITANTISGTTDVATKLGSSTVGSSTKPIYLSDGTATASSSTVGSGVIPMYLSSGTLTASTSTVGSGTKPIYLNSGTLTVSSSTVGSGTKPIYLNSGTLAVSSSTVGSEIIPMYLSSGTLTASTSTVGSGTKPIYLNSGALTVSSSTVGSGVIPMYLSSGTLTASTSTVGSGTKPIYLNSGTLTVSSSTVGSTTQPVYLNSGTITAMSGALPIDYGGTGNTTGTATKITISTLSNTSATSYRCVFVSGTGSQSLYTGNNNGFRINYLTGTADTNGYSRLYLGTSTVSGTAGNEYGGLLIYGTDAYYWLITGNKSTTSNRTIYLPLSGGCLVVATNGSAVGSASTPVYINSSGVATVCTSLSLDTTGNATTATTATKLGSSTVGSGVIPIYLSSGTATASTSTVGSGTKPIYLNSGTLTVSSSTVGSGVIPMYLSSGTFTASTSTVGSGVKPIYLSSGTLTVSSSTVGSGVIPMYLSSGTLTASTSTVGSGTKPIYLSSGTLTVSSSTVGGTATPVYLNSGTISVLSATVGGTAKPTYLNAGVITACSSTVGSGVIPVYMSSGTITASSTTVGSGVKPIYLSSGALTVSSSTVGSGTAPIYLSSGTLTVSTSTVGASATPVYLNSGVITKCGYSFSNYLPLTGGTLTGALTVQTSTNPGILLTNTGSSTATYIKATSWSGYSVSVGVGSGGYNRGIYDHYTNGWVVYIDSSGSIHLGASSVGSGTKPIYLSSGVPTVSSSTVGSGVIPTYLSSGTITASTSTVGSGTKPVYLSSGTITVSSSTVGSTTQPVYLNSGTITAMSGALAIAYGGTGNTSGRATYIEVTLTNPDSSTTYYPSFVAGTSSSSNYYPRVNNGIRYNTLEGTADSVGQGRIYLGNSTASGTAGNKYGAILLYDNSGYYYQISANQSALTASRTLYLPTVTGTSRLVAGANSSATGSATNPVYIAATGVATACAFTSSTSALYLVGVTSSATGSLQYSSTVYVKSGDLYFPNAKQLYFSNASGTYYSLVGFDSNNYLSVGHSSYNTYVKGSNIYMNGAAYSSSDIEVKHDIQPMPSKCLQVLDKMEPVEFIYNQNEDVEDEEIYQFGYIAQDVAQAIKDAGLGEDHLGLVKTGPIEENGEQKMFLNYDSIIAMLHYKIKEQDKEILELQNKLLTIQQLLSID